MIDNIAAQSPIGASSPVQPQNPGNVINKSQAPVESQPPKIKLPPLVWKQTQELMTNLEKLLGGAVVSYYTTGNIVGDDVKYFYTHLSSIGFREKLFFILVSNGGDGKSAYRIASLLKSFCNELVIVIPEIAASAATMLSLAGDSVIMTPLAFLTAVDTSINHPLNPKDSTNQPVRVELEEVRRAIEVLKDEKTEKSEIYKTIFNYIHPVALGSMERTSNLSEMLCRDIIKLRNKPFGKEEEKTLIDKLNRDYPAHGYPITRKIARELGLPVIDSSPELDMVLWKYLNVNRYLTEQVRTDFSDSYFHTEKYLNVIESVGKRLAVRQAMERRLDPILKGWTTLREEYKWESVYEAEENGEKKLKVTYLDF